LIGRKVRQTVDRLLGFGQVALGATLQQRLHQNAGAPNPTGRRVGALLLLLGRWLGRCRLLGRWLLRLRLACRVALLRLGLRLAGSRLRLARLAQVADRRGGCFACVAYRL
jgi:hypothetical protein